MKTLRTLLVLLAAFGPLFVAGPAMAQIGGEQIIQNSMPVNRLSASGATSGQVPEYNGSTVLWATVAGTGLTVTDGTNTETGVSTIDFTSGATVSSGGSGTADVAISGGGGSSLTVSDGTNNIGSVTTLKFTNGATATSGGTGVANVALSFVSSVGLSLPSIFSVTGSPVTSSGMLTGSLANETANTFLAGPSSGSAAAPTFRAITAADLPSGTGTVVSWGWGSLPSWITGSVANATTTPVASLAAATGLTSNEYNILRVDGSGSVGLGQVALNQSGAVTGTLPVGNGGTGQSSYTDGQLLIGDSSTGGLDKATLTAGSNVTITNGHGSITIAASGGGGGGSPTYVKEFGSGSPYTNTASWAVCALGNGNLAVTLPSSGYYRLTGQLELDGGGVAAGSQFGGVLYDSTASAYLPFSNVIFSPLAATSGSFGANSKVFIPIDCIYDASGADTIQVYSYGGTITSSSSPTAEGTIAAARSWIAYEPVSSSSANNQLTNSFPSGLSPVSNYDASAITGVSNGGNVTSWSDGGSAGLALAPSGGSPTYATYVSNFWQGMPAVEFQGSTTKYVTSSVPTTSLAYDMWYIGTVNPTASSNDAYFYNGNTGSNGYGPILGGSASAYAVTPLLGGVSAGTSEYPMPQNGLHVIEIQRSSGNTSIFVDGISLTANAGTPLTPTGSLTMGTQSGTPTFIRYACQAILFSSALSTANQAAMLAYLQAKWHL